MSKGTPRVVIRLADQVVQEIELAIARRNLWSREVPWTLSDFLRVAIAEKLQKMARCRRPRRRPSAPDSSKMNA